jgi:benzylsuccinate CoA-transferase BbsF subunit
MFEVLVQQMAPALIDYQTTGKIPERNGNRIESAAPHGVFPCKGEDRWCAISISTDEEWASLCQLIGSPPAWTTDTRFKSFVGRKENENELEMLIGEWTQHIDAHRLMDMLQSDGVPAGAVQNSEDIFNDPQLEGRQFLAELAHPVLGTFGHIAPYFKLSDIEPKLRTSPCLGEHTEFVCTQLLGMTDDEFVRYFQDSVFV